MPPAAKSGGPKIAKAPRLKAYKVRLAEKIVADKKKGRSRKKAKQEFQKTWESE